MHSKWLWFALALVAVLGLTATASGRVQNMITGKQIAPHSINSAHMVNGTLQAHDLSPALLKSLRGKTGANGAKGDSGATGAKGDKGQQGDNGATGAKGDKGEQGRPGVSGLEADGPYPSLTQLSTYPDAGANSTAAWTSDPTGSTLQQSWVMCAPGKTALGGGFGQDDTQTSKLIIVTSVPAYIDKDGNVDPATTPQADAEGSIIPNGWLVQGYNESASDLVVRPWVICAEVNK